MKIARNVIFAQAAMFIPLVLWRWIYPVSDWAIIALFILWLMLCKGTYVPAITKYRARLGIALRSRSFLSKYLTGRVHAGIVALAFSFLAIPVLAWQALTVTEEEAVGFFALSIISAVAVSALNAWLCQHFKPWAARSVSIAIGATLAAIVFIPLLAWTNWYYAPHPGQILDSRISIADAVSITLDDLPERRGWIAEILAFFYAFDGVKLWLTIRFWSSDYLTALYSLDAAFTGFIFARSSAILTFFLSDEIEQISVKTEK